MTFCFIFVAKHRGGIGIVADRRISIKTAFDGWVPIDDNALKFGMLSDDFGFTFAGSLETVSLVMSDFAKMPPCRFPSKRLDETALQISKIYEKLVSENLHLQAPDAGATLVFFDTFRRHSSQRYRLLQLRLRFDPILQRTFVDNNYECGSDWVAIGGTQRLRRQLAGCAIPDMQEFVRRRVQCRLPTDEEIKALRKRTSMSPDAVVVIQEPGTNSPWREFETYRMLRDFGDARMDYISNLAEVASNAIHWEVKHLKNLGDEDVSTISQEQFIAVFHKAYGLQVKSPSFPE